MEITAATTVSCLKLFDRCFFQFQGKTLREVKPPHIREKSSSPQTWYMDQVSCATVSCHAKAVDVNFQLHQRRLISLHILSLITSKLSMIDGVDLH